MNPNPEVEDLRRRDAYAPKYEVLEVDVAEVEKRDPYSAKYEVKEADVAEIDERDSYSAVEKRSPYSPKIQVLKVDASMVPACYGGQRGARTVYGGCPTCTVRPLGVRDLLPGTSLVLCEVRQGRDTSHCHQKEVNGG